MKTLCSSAGSDNKHFKFKIACSKLWAGQFGKPSVVEMELADYSVSVKRYIMAFTLQAVNVGS